ncbi:MAG TPA: hypothetical protein VMJ13_02645, partial [Candidatus Acidoferrum sp.]|nr:hypothetical protein [Candidatus Acidoferrum sp.]
NSEVGHLNIGAGRIVHMDITRIDLMMQNGEFFSHPVLVDAMKHARTGLSNVLVAALFVAAMFFAPVATAIPGFATAPALILVGALMMQSVARVKWEEFSDAFPAFVTILATPLTFSIATGLSLGVISYTVVKIAAGKIREISALLWILTALFILRYIYLAVA